MTNRSQEMSEAERKDHDNFCRRHFNSFMDIKPEVHEVHKDRGMNPVLRKRHIAPNGEQSVFSHTR